MYVGTASLHRHINPAAHRTVAKTSMRGGQRSNQFSDAYQKTVGVDFLEKALHVDALKRTVRLQLWDTAGQEEFDSLTRSYYRGAAARVLGCSQ